MTFARVMRVFHARNNRIEPDERASCFAINTACEDENNDRGDRCRRDHIVTCWRRSEADDSSRAIMQRSATRSRRELFRVSPFNVVS